MSKTEKATREYLETLSKEQVINLCLQFMFDAEISEQQLAEKDKEIEHLKINYFNLVRNIDKFADKQLAIQELEKVKILLQNAVNYEGYTFVGIYDAVNNQIKELKGE